MAFGRCVRVWSSTQTVVARSSGEAEYYAAVKGASEGIGLQSTCKDLGMELAVFVWTDSSACRGICCRTGLGTLRHMDVQLLWLQGVVRRRHVVIRRVGGKWNPADLMTKHLGRKDVDWHLDMLLFREARNMTSNFAPWRPAGRKTRADILVRLIMHNCAE